jgi:hypothetical protein
VISVAESFEVDITELARRGIEIDRVAETARSILGDLKGRLVALGPLAGGGDVAAEFLKNYLPALEAGLDLLGGVQTALITGSDQVFLNSKSFLNTETVNVQSTHVST